MTINAEYAYKASLKKIYKHLTDEAFLRKKYEGIGSRNLEFRECAQDEDVFRIEWTREVPADPPAFAKKFVGEWNTLDEIMEWTLEGDIARADYEGTVRGIPGTIFGEFEVRPDGKGCVEIISMEASIKIPLVGKKISKLVEDDIEVSLDKEFEFTRGFLKEK